MIELALRAFLTLFVVVDPVGIAPVFLALAGARPKAWQARIARRAVVVGGGVLFFFALGRPWLLGKLGISMDAFRIAGGIVLENLFFAGATLPEKASDLPGQRGKELLLQLEGQRRLGAGKEDPGQASAAGDQDGTPRSQEARRVIPELANRAHSHMVARVTILRRPPEWPRSARGRARCDGKPRSS